MHRYAWLELDGGMWHLLTNLFGIPDASTRKWADQRQAFVELMNEGWTVVRPYSEQASICRNPGKRVSGYGLTRQIH